MIRTERLSPVENEAGVATAPPEHLSAARLLAVDDEPAACRLLSLILAALAQGDTAAQFHNGNFSGVAICAPCHRAWKDPKICVEFVSGLQNGGQQFSLPKVRESLVGSWEGKSILRPRGLRSSRSH